MKNYTRQVIMQNASPLHPAGMKQLPAFISAILLSVAVAGQQNFNTANAAEIKPPVSFEQLKKIYDTLIPAFDGLFIRHYHRDKHAPVHIDDPRLRPKPSRLSRKWGVVDSSGNVIVPFICDGVKGINQHKGVASVYAYSFPLNTGVPRYRYTGKYFYFTKTGRTGEAEKEFTITAVFISDWHWEGFVVQNGPEFYLPDQYRDKKFQRY